MPDGITPASGRRDDGTAEVVVIGAGQAGLSMAACLQRRGIRPLVLERQRVAYAWEQQRWDSFCLVTPNWQCRLPDYPYQGTDPEGFMGREDIVAYVRGFASRIDAALREGVAVERLHRCQDTYVLGTSAGELRAAQVVVATGAYHRPRRPALATRLPPAVLQLDALEYRNPEQLPEGSVLVVGSGQSGCQIAEDLFFAGRRVHLCVGSAPRSPRRYRGKDVVEWLERMGHYAMPIDQQEDPSAVRSKTNHYLTGRDGGREIDLRQRASEGMVLHGRLDRVEDDRIYFADDLATNLDVADATHARIRSSIDAFIELEGIEAPPEPAYQPPWHPPARNVPIGLSDEPLAAVIWATGYRPDFSWIEVEVLDASGYPLHQRGMTPQAGLYFLGLPWLHTWGSGRFCGVAADAEHLAEAIAQRRRGGGAQEERLERMALLGS